MEYVHLSNCSSHHLHHRQNLRTDFGIAGVVGSHRCSSHIESLGAQHLTIWGKNQQPSAAVPQQSTYASPFPSITPPTGDRKLCRQAERTATCFNIHPLVANSDRC